MEHFLAKISAKMGAPVTDGGQTDLDHPAPRAWSFKARWQTSALAPQLQFYDDVSTRYTVDEILAHPTPFIQLGS